MPVAYSADTTNNKTKENNQPEPDLTIDEISGGFGVTVVITNAGEADANDVTWKIDLDGEYIITGGYTLPPLPVIENIPAGESIVINSWRDRFIVGFGETNINITVECAEDSVQETAKGRAFGFYIGVTEG